MILLYLKNGKFKICITVLIAEEICSWLSPFHKQIASPFSSPTKMTANNIFLQPMNHFAFPLFIYTIEAFLFLQLSIFALILSSVLMTTSFFCVHRFHFVAL